MKIQITAKSIYTLLMLTLLTSCAQKYTVNGSTDLTALDGQKLYLKIYNENDMKNVDSCEVVHGQFHFSGVVDSTSMTTLFLDDVSLMPIVLEEGTITPTTYSSGWEEHPLTTR